MYSHLSRQIQDYTRAQSETLILQLDLLQWIFTNKLVLKQGFLNQ